MVILKINPMALKLPPPGNIEEKYYFFHIWQNVIYLESEKFGNFDESSLKMYPFENLPYCISNFPYITGVEFLLTIWQKKILVILTFQNSELEKVLILQNKWKYTTKVIETAWTV